MITPVILFALLSCAFAQTYPGIIARLKTNVVDLQENIQALEELNSKASCIDGLVYENSCIRFLFATGNYSQAQKYCSSAGKLVEITSNNMYDAVYDYVQSTWIQKSSKRDKTIDVWIGQTYHSENNPNDLLTLSTGARVEINRWQRNKPTQFSTWQGVMMEVAIATDSESGLTNFVLDWPFPHPICQYQLS